MTKIAEFTNSIDPDKAAQYELPHQDLHCLSCIPRIRSMIQLGKTIPEIFAYVNYFVCFLAPRVKDKTQMRWFTVSQIN